MGDGYWETGHLRIGTLRPETRQSDYISYPSPPDAEVESERWEAWRAGLDRAATAEPAAPGYGTLPWNSDIRY